MENTINIKQENIEALFKLVADAYDEYSVAIKDYHENGGIERAVWCDSTRHKLNNMYKTIEVLGIEDEYFDWKKSNGYTN